MSEYLKSKESKPNLDKQIENIVKMVDVEDFYADIYKKKDRKEGIGNLFNIYYLADKKIIENVEGDKIDISLYNFRRPANIIELPSSDDSDDEKKKKNSFKEIVNQIIDRYYLKEEKELLDKEYPILEFEKPESIKNIDSFLDLLKNEKINPITIHITKVKDINCLLIKLKNKQEASFIIEKIKKELKIKKLKIYYDKRDNNNFYCVIFRKEAKTSSDRTLFGNNIEEIYKEIKSEPKRFLIKDDSQPEDENINNKIYHYGKTYYCAIEVSSLEEAVGLCIKKNKINNMKVHLHPLTLKCKQKSLLPAFNKKMSEKEVKNINKKYKKERETLDEEENFYNNLFSFQKKKEAKIKPDK